MLALNAPGALTPLYQSIMSRKLDVNEMLQMLETTCENILSTDPTALMQAKEPSALALASFGRDICTSYNGTGRATSEPQTRRRTGQRHRLDRLHQPQQATTRRRAQAQRRHGGVEMVRRAQTLGRTLNR